MNKMINKKTGVSSLVVYVIYGSFVYTDSEKTVPCLLSYVKARMPCLLSYVKARIWQHFSKSPFFLVKQGFLWLIGMKDGRLKNRGKKYEFSTTNQENFPKIWHWTFAEKFKLQLRFRAIKRLP